MSPDRKVQWRVRRMKLRRTNAKVETTTTGRSDLPSDQFSPARSEIRTTQSVKMILKNMMVQLNVIVFEEEERKRS